MNTSSDSENTPIPKKRTVTTGHRMRPVSPESPVTSSPSPTKRHHRQPPVMPEADTSELRQAGVPKPKPKPRRVPPQQSTSTTTPSAPPASSKNQEDGPPRPMSPPKPHVKSKRRARKSAEAGAEGIIEPDVAAGRGDDGSVLRIQDILHAFQDDVVTVKSSQRNKWQEKLDEIQSQLLFPEHEHRKFETVSGGDGGSVPSKWKSAASLIPRDTTPGGRDGDGFSTAHFTILKIFEGIHSLGSFSSGIVTGLLVWKALFAVSQMISGQGVLLSPFFWITFWTMTSLLLLVTVLGFLNSCRIDVEDFSLLTSLLRFIPCMLIFGSYYLSKAFDLQRAECGKYLEVRKQDLRHVHLTYTCDDPVAGKSWETLNYWKISLDMFPALGAIIIYTLLHFRSNSTRSLKNNSDSISSLPC